MSPSLEFLLLVFLFIARIAVPLLVLFGALYLIKRWLEPRFTGSAMVSRIRARVAIPPVLIAMVSLVLLVLIGWILYALATNQFIDWLVGFRDVVVLAYMFFVRLVLPFALLFGIGAWIERKLNPNAAREAKPLSARLPFLQRIHLPRISARAMLAILFVAVLWTAAIGIAVARFFFGLSYVTNLNDQYPWGIWIGFDVVSGVALAAGGFVMAGTVHVFNIKKYHPIVRPAILTALLGYLLVIVGLLFDLGRWYNVWHPIFMWNVHSPMFEVAWCVMLYTTVLILEFSPVIFEKFNLKWPLKVMRAITIPLVILGMGLSTLHQSSLGSLFLIVPQKINPLWYSPLLPVFFFISAVCVGLGMTIVESNLSARALGKELETDLLKGLGRAATIVIAFYLALKFADLVARGALGYAFEPGFHATLFWTEILLGFAVPMVLMAFAKFRSSPRLVFLSGGLIVGGVVLNRLNTSLLGWWSYANGSAIYIPSWSEITVTLSLVVAGVVAFGLAAKFLPIFTSEHAHA